MLSFLAARAAVLGPKFAELHPGAWLVWEPGRWHPTGQPGQKTMVGSRSPGQPQQGDALCFQLKCKVEVDALRVGRVPEKNELVVNDSTVSREHVVLECQGGDGWKVMPVRDRVARLDGFALPTGKATPLKSGSALVLGSVRLTFYSPAGFLERLEAALSARA